MESFLQEGLKEINKEEATQEIKKEEESKLPTITIAIVSHGMDLINEKLPIDSNVRIYSRAGQPLCLGVINSNPINFVEDLYYTNERMNGEDKRTTYEMLQAVAEHYKMPQHDEEFVKTIFKEIEKYLFILFKNCIAQVSIDFELYKFSNFQIILNKSGFNFLGLCKDMTLPVSINTL